MSQFNIAYIYQAIDKFSPKARKINKSVKLQARLFKKLGHNVEKSRAVFAGAFVALSGGLIASAIAAAKFEKQITNVFTLLDKETLKKFGPQLEVTAENAVKMGFSIQDSNKALFDSVSAIGNVKKSIEVYNTAQKLAKGGVTSLSVAVSGITSLVNAYGKETTKATDVANAFFSSQKMGKTTVEALAMNIGKVAPIAKQAGIGFKTLTASIAQLTLGGLSTDEASTALKGAIKGLIAPSDQAAKVLKHFNIPMGASALQSADFTDVLEKLAIAAKKYPDALALMIPDQRAMTAVAALGTKEIGNLRNIIKSINNDIKNGTGLNEAYNMQLKTMSERWSRLTGRIVIIAKKFGKLLFPIMSKVFEIGEKILNFILNLSPGVKKAILAVVLLATAFTGTVTAIAAFLAMTGALIASLLVIKISFLLAWSAALGPVGLIIAGITALAALGTVLYKKWKPFQIAMDQLAKTMKSIGKIATLGFMKNLTKVVTAKFSGKPKVGEGVPAIGNIPISAEPVKQNIAESFINSIIKIVAPKDTVKAVQTNKRGAGNINTGLNLEEIPVGAS